MVCCRFAAMYDAGRQSYRRDITGIRFARIKLLCSQIQPEFLSDAQSLACIGARIPIKFKSVNRDKPTSELMLVASHMRMLLYAGCGLWV